jgi:diguanylate cyclase (GGDEF)-like protein/PAS domain S-box-containing protein
MWRSSPHPEITSLGEQKEATMTTRRHSVKPTGTKPEPTDERLRASEESFRLLVGNVLDYAIFMLDPDGRVVSWNPGAERLKGYREEEILGQSFSRFYPREDVERGKPQHGLQLASAEGRFEEEGWRVRKNGSIFWANVVITAIRDKAGELLGFAKITRDSTERRLATERLKASEAQLQTFMNHSPSLMFIKDLEGRYLHVNQRFTRAFGLERKDIIFRTDSEIFSPELAAQFRANDAKALAARAGIELEETARYGDGLLHTSIVHKFPMLDSNGQVTALGGIATDITERKSLEEALRQKNIQLNTAIQTEMALREHQEHLKVIATHDALTGVPNRELLHQRAKHAIAVSRRSSRLLGLLFIDLDRFKDVNDSLGHAAGDAVLREVATRLSGCLREVDTIARHGGDEFVVLLEELQGPEEVEQVTARMQEVLAEPLAVEGREVSVTISIGVALCPRDGEEMSTLIRRADLAMYRAKELGRNTIQFYTPDLDTSSTARLSIET